MGQADLGHPQGVQVRLRNVNTPSQQSLTIGDLSTATGVTVQTLRVWESRHGFPRPERRVSGHRRYSPAEIDAVRQVLAHRDAGLRLDAAIARVTTAEAPTGSVYAAVLDRHPEQPRQVLRKSTLIGLSWAIEDEILANARRGHVFGSFQHAQNFDAARHRWAEIARTSLSTHVLADFPGGPAEAPSGVELVAIAPDSPMHREWAVVCDAPRMTLLLTAWEVPGQDDVDDLDRHFESVWTADPGAVRTAAQTCAAVAGAAGSRSASDLARGALNERVFASPDSVTVTRLAQRAVAYVESLSRPRTPR